MREANEEQKRKVSEYHDVDQLEREVVHDTQGTVALQTYIL